MTEEKKIEPQGVIAIMTRSDGYVIATAADFERQGYGGFKLWEAQRIRAERDVKFKAVRAYCSDFLYNALDSYTVERMAEDMCQRERGKHKITLRSVGYPDDIKEAIERR